MTVCLSIVTVTYNDIEGLCRTLDSLVALAASAGGAVEVIVQDGGTIAFPTNSLRKRYPYANIESGKDGGIYHGMNRGIERAHGRWLWFLNGGDRCLLTDWRFLRDVLSHHRDSVLLFDYTLHVGSRKIYRRSRPAFYIHHGLPTSHQAIIYPAQPLKERGYNLNYTIAGDYELTARLWVNGSEFVRLSRNLAEFDSGGVSQAQSHRIAIEAECVQRTTLRVGRLVRLASNVLHAIARWRRDFQTR